MSKESVNYINPVYKLAVRDAKSVPRRISYSQWSMYERCPLSWKLAYIDGLAEYHIHNGVCMSVVRYLGN
jgi:hypothetical protein